MPLTTLDHPIATGRTAEIYPWRQAYVLKLIRPGFPPYLADQEERGARIACQAGIPAPEPDGLIEIEGRRGVVLQRIDGPTLNQHLARYPYRLGQFARIFAHLHASVHAAPAPNLPSQRERILRNLDTSPYLPQALKSSLLTLLSSLPDGNCLCHEDFHLENILLTINGPVIIDWESCTSGQPCADIAQTCLTMRVSVDRKSGVMGFIARQAYYQFEKIYLTEYKRKTTYGSLIHLEDWIAIRAATRMRDDNQAEFPYLLNIIQRSNQ